MAKTQLQGNGRQSEDGERFRGTTDSLAETENPSLGPPVELNGSASDEKQPDRYGFIGGTQQHPGDP